MAIASGKGNQLAQGKGRGMVTFHRISSNNTFQILYYAHVISLLNIYKLLLKSVVDKGNL